MNKIGKHIAFLKSLLLQGEVSFLSKNEKEEFVIETKLYLDGDIICNIFSENEEEVIELHLARVKNQVNLLRHLSRYITLFFASISTAVGYFLQADPGLPVYQRVLIFGSSISAPVLFKKPLFKGSVSFFTFISKLFMSNGALKRFTS